MKVTGHLREPVLDPCPNRDDLQTLVDDTCGPAQCTRPRDGLDPGVDCCQFWSAPDTWQDAKIRVDQIDPEKFKYEQYRYQLYAKPTHFDCGSGIGKLDPVPDRHYEPPVTDIRALRQSTVVPVMPGAAGPGLGAGAGIPVVPSKPGGVPEVTFPMTQATLGQPDVTTACCVPVVPCQQGYQNLTPHIKPGVRCHQAPQPGRPLKQLGPQRPDACSGFSECQKGGQQQAPPLTGSSCLQPGCGSACGPAPQQFVLPPANRQSASCVGLTPIFPNYRQVYSAPPVQQLQVPRPDFQVDGNTGLGQDGQCLSSGASCFDTGLEDGLNPRGGKDTACTNVSTFRYQDRVWRDFNSVKESPQERRQRLTRMSGAYGAALQPKSSARRAVLPPKDNILLQGNGFSWGGYPKHENRLCYVLERNARC